MPVKKKPKVPDDSVPEKKLKPTASNSDIEGLFPKSVITNCTFNLYRS